MRFSLAAFLPFALPFTALAIPFSLAAVVFGACSSSDAGSPDASVGALAALGAACDGTLANACAPAATGCAANVCTSGVCTQVLVSGDPSCGDTGALPPTNALCATSADCDAGVCGFLSGAGCSVTGVCVVPEVDASLPSPACGCNGLPDPYVASGFASAPASSAGECVDGGSDGAAEAGDDDDGGASTDAASDAKADAFSAADAAAPNDGATE